MIFFYMKSPAEYNWNEAYFDSDVLWLDDTLNWDSSFEVATSDYLMFSSLLLSSFTATNFFLDSWSKLSFLDVWFVSDSTASLVSQHLYEAFTWDLLPFFSVNFLLFQFLFFTDYQDFIIILLNHSPELLFVALDFTNNYFLSYTLGVLPAASFDLFTDALNISLSEFLEYFLSFFFIMWSLLYFVNTFRLSQWALNTETYWIRIYYYLFTISRETRLQLEAVLKLVFFFLLYFAMMVATFDDDQEELLELFHLISFYAFLLVFLYLLYRYSIHYFAFLQATQETGRLVGLLGQFAQDMANTFALTLRFLVLMIRLNMYDFLDDVLDSYYIFVCDFDDDEYYSELFFSFFTLLFFDTDNNDDRSFFFEDELDFSLDLFSIYFVIWSKFSLFFFFAMEEIARVFLAFYLVYLIIFEMQAVNRSFSEEKYLILKRETGPSFYKKNIL